MPGYSFHRHVRTPYSEGYEIRRADTRLGHLDLHYTSQDVYGTLILEQETDEDGVLDIIESIDEEIVLSAEVPREDFLVSVYHGQDTGLYNDEFLRERYGDEGRP